jgi:hypothetical protein
MSNEVNRLNGSRTLDQDYLFIQKRMIEAKSKPSKEVVNQSSPNWTWENELWHLKRVANDSGYFDLI